MSFSLTLVASAATPHLPPAHLARVEGTLDQLNLRATGAVKWLNPHMAAQMTLDDLPRPDQMRVLQALLAPDQIDVFAGRNRTDPPKLFIADMDSTILQGETLDEIAAHFGIGPQVAAITANAMRGEMDFEAALEARLKLLDGAPVATLDTVWQAQKFSPGATTLLATLRAHGTLCVLVSGGYTFFTERVADTLGFHHHHGNTLATNGDRIAARLIPPLINGESKQALLYDYTLRFGITTQDVMAVGDGANDLPMLQSAGLGVGYRPKPLLRENMTNHILYGDLTALLYAWGMDQDQILST